MDIHAYNRQAWDKLVEDGNRWTLPVTAEKIQRAKQGDWQIVLTPIKPVPKSWLIDIPGKTTLCLASGGGQQGPLLAAVSELHLLSVVAAVTMSAVAMLAVLVRPRQNLFPRMGSASAVLVGIYLLNLYVMYVLE